MSMPISSVSSGATRSPAAEMASRMAAKGATGTGAASTNAALTTDDKALLSKVFGKDFAPETGWVPALAIDINLWRETGMLKPGEELTTTSLRRVAGEYATAGPQLGKLYAVLQARETEQGQATADALAAGPDTRFQVHPYLGNQIDVFA